MVESSDLIGPARIRLNVDIRYSPDSIVVRYGWHHGSPTALAPGGPAAKCENSSPTASHITLSESILDLYRDVHDC
jgi:hypothetical protein